MKLLVQTPHGIYQANPWFSVILFLQKVLLDETSECTFIISVTIWKVVCFLFLLKTMTVLAQNLTVVNRTDCCSPMQCCFSCYKAGHSKYARLIDPLFYCPEKFNVVKFHGLINNRYKSIKIYLIIVRILIEWNKKFVNERFNELEESSSGLSVS